MLRLPAGRKLEANRAIFCELVDGTLSDQENRERIDEVVVTYFAAPHSLSLIHIFRAARVIHLVLLVLLLDWTIVLVTVLINLALLPLRISQIKSAMKMQKAAPHIQAIQEKYKKYKMDDPRRSEMNKEVAALYKEHDVNPVGGCLPLIIQMPFLFAFYTMPVSYTHLTPCRGFQWPQGSGRCSARRSRRTPARGR